MEKRLANPYLVLIVLLLATSLALALSVDVRTSDTAGVRAELPQQVGAWRGDELRFCQTATCQREFLASTLADRDVCPACSNKLEGMSLIERRLLPADTVLIKKRYTNPTGAVIYASVVISGRERASIHRPEVCLQGSGTEIVNQSMIEVPLPGRAPLQVMVLDLLQRRRLEGGQEVASGSYYAYWFVGNGRETPSHWRRMYWMATDRILHNIAHRWAYISVASGRDVTGKFHREQSRDFIRDLYPQMLIEKPDAPSST